MSVSYRMNLQRRSGSYPIPNWDQLIADHQARTLAFSGPGEDGLEIEADFPSPSEPRWQKIGELQAETLVRGMTELADGTHFRCELTLSATSIRGTLRWRRRFRPAGGDDEDTEAYIQEDEGTGMPAGGDLSS